MIITVATDSLKGSLTTWQAGNAIAEGAKKAFPDAEIFVRPIADGGEGTVDALASENGGRIEKIKVHNPLGDIIESCYGIIENTKTAFIEMSAAAGITLISTTDRNPLNTTTYGVGEIIKDAILKGCRNFIVGIGGSATNDCGIGMLQSLGFEFLDACGKQVPFGAKGLEKICVIKKENALPELE